jgi:hypothetical protein
MSKFENEVMLYLRNLTSKFQYLSEKLHRLEEIMLKGFQATGMAFHQTKEVCQAIVDETKKNTEHLDEFGGTIEAESFFDGVRQNV